MFTFWSHGGSSNQVYQSSIKVGPWGGLRGTRWSYMPKGGIVEIIINHGDIIDSLSFKSVCANKETESSSNFGGEGGNKTQISIDWPEEYLTSISGTTIKFNNTESYNNAESYVESLTFYTNWRTHGPFGFQKGTHFSLPVENRVIVGFHGRAGKYMYAIGIYQKAETSIQGQFMTHKVYQSSIEVGPWGGLGGAIWSYMPEGGIVEIIITHGVFIDSLSFKSVRSNNVAESSSNFGGKGESKTQISIDWPEEYLTSISGTTIKNNDTEYVESLTFYTNWRTHGPFGYEKGTHFSLPIENRVIVGFHGRAGRWMDAIGVYQKAATSIQGQFMTPKVTSKSVRANNVVESPSNFGGKGGNKTQVYQSSIEVGPWGSLGGTRWSYLPKGGIVEIIINHGVVIDSLSFKSVCANKEAESSGNFGGEGGNKTQISIDWPKEYLTSISGTTLKHNNVESFVESLTFYTNWHTYGPFGSEKGTHFSLPVENRVIIGFHGRADIHMYAIGVYQKTATSIQGQFMTPKVYQSSIELGPWGGLGGTIWSYMPEGGIVEIIINHGVFIDSLSFKSVDANNVIESSSNFGGIGGNKTQISIDWPEEYLMSISGTTVKYNNTEFVESLTFYTNWRTHGPFGYEKGTHFSLPVENRVIVGFHGRAGTYMDAIGVYQKAATSIQFMTPKVTSKSFCANNVAESSSNFGGKGGNKTQISFTNGSKQKKDSC